MAGVIIQAVISLLTLAAIVSFAAVPPTDLHLTRFAQTYEVPITADNRHLLYRYIWWSRMWRIGGAIVALVVLAGVGRLTGHDTGGWFTALAIGYPIGATIGEIVRPQPPRGAAPARASLERRGVDQYLSPLMIRVLGTVVMITGICTVAVAVVPSPAADTAGYISIAGVESTDTRWLVVGAMTAALGLVAIMGLVARAVTRRPQRPASPAVDAVQHAIRSAAIVSFGGSALAVSSLAAAFALSRLALVADDLPHTVTTPLNLAYLVAMLMAFIGFGLSLRSIPRCFPLRPRTAIAAEPT